MGPGEPDFNYFKALSDDVIINIAENLDDKSLLKLALMSKGINKALGPIIIKRKKIHDQVKLFKDNLEKREFSDEYVFKLKGKNITDIFPETISELANSKDLQGTTIELNENQLKELPETIGQLTNLKNILLNKNQLKALPESIVKLTNLEWLCLYENKLTALPKIIGQLTNLKSLDLNFNQLTALPETIGQLTNLKNILLNKNQLKALPESIGQLTNLKWLLLYKNQLTELPESIVKLTNLEILVLSGNYSLDKEKIEALRKKLPHTTIIFDK